MAQRFAQTSRGIVAFRLHRVFDVHAGFSKRHEDLVLSGIYQDGRVVRVRVNSYTIDGRPVDMQQQAALAQEYQNPKPGETFAPPFDARNAGDYSYEEQAPGTIAFTSALRDAAHGNGTFTYDETNSVVAYTYQPNVLPPHATWGEIADRRAEVLPNYWTVTQETQNYKGSYGPFPGAGTVQIDFTGFRRFPNLRSALAAL
ncbi:MAG TPA: hypothetical protein VHS56_04595 [Candidatus Cybelea sp.]|nr:hypothetical protein [Candidatus Cybelea sp.]